MSHWPELGQRVAAAAAKSLQSCPTLCDPIDGSPPGFPVPGILQARTLEWVAISFSQCMKVKNESEVAQSCPTLCDPMDCSPPGSFVHGDSPGKNTGVGCHALLQGIFPTQGSNPGLPHCRQILYCLSHQGNPQLGPKVQLHSFPTSLTCLHGKKRCKRHRT